MIRCSALNTGLLFHTARASSPAAFTKALLRFYLAVLLETAGAMLTVTAAAVQLLRCHSTPNTPAVMLPVVFC